MSGHAPRLVRMEKCGGGADRTVQDRAELLRDGFFLSGMDRRGQTHHGSDSKKAVASNGS
jgi:hypothetical protein